MVMVLLSACGPDSTKEVIVYEENIGMPDSMFGTYKIVSHISGNNEGLNSATIKNKGLK